MAPLPELHTPTPVFEARPGLWVKDESTIAAPYGGNKVRKLSRILRAVLARDRAAVVTCGGVGSHHVYATAKFARACGLDTHAVLFPGPRSPDAEAHAAGIVRECRSITTCETPAAASRTMAELSRRHDAEVVAVGGSSVEGTLGWVDGGRELAAQIAAGQLPPIGTAWVPSASGGTAVGLAIGLAAAGRPCRVVALRVDDFLTPRRLARLVERVRARVALGPIEVEIAEATGRPDQGPGLPLDPRYTAPAWATCLARRDSTGPDLFVHTASARVPPPDPSPPPALEALFFPTR